jgi:MFS family permease
MTGLWLLLDSITAVLPQVLAKQSKLDSTHITWVLVVMYAVLTAVFVVGGALSQRMGRRRYLIVFGVVALAAGIPSYLALITITAGDFGAAVGWATLTCAVVVAPWAVVTAYLSERFQTANRSIGFGLGYSLAVILPSFYATYMQWLSGAMPARLSVLVIVGSGAVLVAVAAAIGPETIHIHFKAADTRSAPAPAVSTDRSA